MVSPSNSPLPLALPCGFAYWQSAIMRSISYLAWRDGRRHDDESQDNALCFAFDRWQSTSVDHGEVTLQQLAYQTARYGWNRASRGQQYVVTHRAGYVDAMDRINPESVISAPIVDERFAWIEDTEERDLLVASLPPKLASVALLLSAGENQREIAAALGLSQGTISTRCDELRVLVREYLATR